MRNAKKPSKSCLKTLIFHDFSRSPGDRFFQAIGRLLAFLRFFKPKPACLQDMSCKKSAKSADLSSETTVLRTLVRIGLRLQAGWPADGRFGSVLAPVSGRFALEFSILPVAERSLCADGRRDDKFSDIRISTFEWCALGLGLIPEPLHPRF